MFLACSYRVPGLAFLRVYFKSDAVPLMAALGVKPSHRHLVRLSVRPLAVSPRPIDHQPVNGAQHADRRKDG